MFRKIEDWVKSIIAESQAITWPNRKRVYTDSMIVVVSLVLGTAILAAIDYGFLQLFKAAISKIG